MMLTSVLKKQMLTYDMLTSVFQKTDVNAYTLTSGFQKLMLANVVNIGFLEKPMLI